MKKFVTAALAIVLAGSVSFADPGDNEWLELDSEINSLATNLRPAKDGNGWTALIRATYAYSTDEIAGAGAGSSDVGNLDLDDVDLAFWGAVGDYSWRISVDIDGDDTGDVVGLEDAYVTWACGDAFTATLGNFKASVLHSNMVDPENQLMIDRTALGAAFDNWDAGVGAHGSWEDLLSWSASVQNGDDDAASGLWALRAEFDLGEEMAQMESAIGGGEQLNATVGLSFVNDDSAVGASSDNQAYFVDFNGNMGPIGFGGEYGSLGENFDATIGGAGSDWSHLGTNTLTFGDGTDSTSPYSLTVSYLVNEKVEIGLRYEDLDNADGNTITSVCANWYQSEHNAKWQAQWSDFGADGTNPDGSIFQVGVVVGASR